MGDGTATIDFSDLGAKPVPQSGGGGVDFSDLGGKVVQAAGGATTAQPQKDSLWRRIYDTSVLGQLRQATGGLSEWAKGKAEQAQTQNLRNVARGGQGNPVEAFSPRSAYDLLSKTSGFVSSFLDPKSLAITGGVIAANTNPFTGIPVDAALVAHGGYGVAKNARQALAGNPDAAERALLSGSEMVGGLAGTAGQVRAGARLVQNLKGGTAEQAPGGPGRIAQTLGISDPPPNELLTKAIKPTSANTGWNSAIAKAAPDMKAAEADLGHPITGVDDALNAASVAKKALWQQYATKLKSASTGFAGEETGAVIDGNEVADAMMKSIDKRTALQDPGLVERITKVADTYRRLIPVEEAEDFLQSANNDLHAYYAKNKVGRQVAAKDPATGHIVAEADQLRDSLYSKLDDMTGPGAAELKGRYGALSNVEAELLRRKNVSARQQPESLAEQISMARAYGKIAVGAARMSPGSLLEGAQSLYAAKWLKARGTTDAMISRAFKALGPQSAPTTPAPASVGPKTVSGMSAAAGGAARDDSEGSNLF